MSRYIEGATTEFSTRDVGEKKSKMSLSCRQCEHPIKFDDNHVSQRTGKKTPLDIETNEPHDCPARKSNTQQQQQSQQPEHTTKGYYSCREGCGQEIYFDANNKSQKTNV